MTTATTRRGLFQDILEMFLGGEDITQFEVYWKLHPPPPNASLAEIDRLRRAIDPDEIGRIRSALGQMYQRGMLIRVKKGRNLGNGKSECAVYRKAP